MSVPPPPPPPGFSISYYGFEPCCGGPIVYFRFDGTTDAPNEGINIYNGPAAIGYNPITDSYVPLENNQCYKVFRGEATDPASPIDGTNYGNLQVVPTAFGTNYIWDATSNYETPCGDEEPGFCPSCETQCYDLWPCDGALVAVTTDTDLSAYLNTFASIQVNADFGFSCYYVTLSTSCINAVTVVVDGDTPCVPCDCTCYEIIGTAKLNYVDCDGNPIQTFVNGYWKGCTLTYPITDPAPGPNLVVTSHGDCVDGQCPGQCYELVDCEGLLDPIYTTAQSLSPYATLGQTVVIQGYTNCWTVNTSLTCDCAIDVVVVQVYADCGTCNPAPNYVLSNCDDLNTVIYTSTDLSEYVGKVLEISPDCPGCWLVEQVNGPIPSDVPITVITSFTDCEACKTTYYRLADCLEIQSDIVTFTDLSQYVGQVIKLEWCSDVCWQVSVSQTSANAGLLGDIVNEFNTCQECIDTFLCVCKRIKNHDSVAHNYDYLDCEGIVQTITLLSGERSERICMKLLLTSFTTDYVETFGNCTNGECPPQIYPKRIVTPGYKTPICSTEKYEKITCKSAEILYKQVLNLRYGITNCCPEEDDKWLLKKQIIDLQALVDPNYICMPSTCGCPSSSCGCGSTNSCNCH
jgi:hypothetical protein